MYHDLYSLTCKYFYKSVDRRSLSKSPTKTFTSFDESNVIQCNYYNVAMYVSGTHPPENVSLHKFDLFNLLNCCSYSTLFSLSLQPLTVFTELSYGRRDFAKIEGRKTEKGKVGRVAEGEVGKNTLRSQNGVTWREGSKSRRRKWH